MRTMRTPEWYTLTPKELKRFENSIDRTGDCHLWVGAGKIKKTAHNYGHFGLTRNGISSYVVASRLAFVLAGGDPQIPVVRHRCDNPPCVNPEHLLGGTTADNINDAVERGRHKPRGITITAQERRKRDDEALAGLQTCTHCNITKPLNQYWRETKGRWGYQTICTTCNVAKYRIPKQRPAGQS